ncbi:MAG: gamma-glutamyl-gamma-aminobutyrate hydrolase family protein [Candidatus Aegiribacteria sp.]
MRRPVIGLTLNWQRNDGERVPSCGRWLFSLNQSYADLMGTANTVPVGIVPSAGGLEGILDILDMVVLTGGGDPDPDLYGQLNCGSVDCRRERPLWEMEFYRSARRRGIPVLGICLGIQLIGIAEGEQLIQDIPAQVDNPCHHHGRPGSPASHMIALTRGTFLNHIFGDGIEVSSHHHQAVSDVPGGFRVAARSSDGVIEAMESDDGGVVAVQWHPERDFTGPVLLRGMLDRLKR